MIPRILKQWHQWGWAFHITWAMLIMATYFFDYKNSMANNTKDIALIIQEHKEENMKERMAVQESTVREISRDIGDIKETQGKIFDRINTIADRKH